jgi:integrase/recombinase XerC
MNVVVSSFLNFIEFEKQYSLHTCIAYKTDIQQFEDFLIDFCAFPQAEQATFQEVRAWVVHLDAQGVEARSINRKVATLKAFFKFLLKQGTIQANPTKRLKPLKVPQKSPNFVEEEKMLKLLDQYPFELTFIDKRAQTILELLYCTGIRLSELLALKHQDIDHYNATVRITGKGNKQRILPIMRTLLGVIQSYEQTKKELLGNFQSQDALIVTNVGKPAYPLLVYKTVRAYLGWVTTQDKRSPHTLRHTFATHLLNKGANINAIKDLLGHTSLQATQIYSHNTLDRLREVFEQAHPKA